MKLRIDPDKICFRLTLGELNHLLDQGEIKEVVTLPNGCLTYQVICLPEQSNAEFTGDTQNYTLSLAREVIENHKENLPSMDGIISKFPCRDDGVITVSLAVNLKKKPTPSTFKSATK